MVSLDEVTREFSMLRRETAGVFLWGSHATGSAHARSDVDVCLVAGPTRDAVEVLLRGLEIAGRAETPYDVRVFEELPLFLKGAMLDSGRLAFAEDPVALQSYLWPWRKVWADQQARTLAARAERPGNGPTVA